MRRGTMDRTIVAKPVLFVSPVEQQLAQIVGQLLDGVSGRRILIAHAIDHVKPTVAARLKPAGTKAAGWESVTETAAAHLTTAVRNFGGVNAVGGFVDGIVDGNIGGPHELAHHCLAVGHLFGIHLVASHSARRHGKSTGTFKFGLVAGEVASSETFAVTLPLLGLVVVGQQPLPILEDGRRHDGSDVTARTTTANASASGLHFRYTTTDCPFFPWLFRSHYPH